MDLRSQRTAAVLLLLGAIGAISVFVAPTVGLGSTLPSFDGVQSFPAIQQPADPEEYSWQVELGTGQSLRLVDDQHAVVENANGQPAFEIVASLAHDANGASVPTAIAVSESDVLTLIVHHRAGNLAAGGAPFAYPITEGAGWDGGFSTVPMQGPKDEQELRKEREAREHAAHEGAPGADQPAAQGVRYAGHVWLAHTSCCGFNTVVFKTFGRRHVPYRVCVQRPNGSKRCKQGHTGESGEPSKKQFISSQVGVYRVTWIVGGRVVDRSRWTNSAEGV